MKQIKHSKTIQEIIDGAYCPLNISVIPNYMGINLCNVHSIDWTMQEDNQIVNLTINFKPSKES